MLKVLACRDIESSRSESYEQQILPTGWMCSVRYTQTLNDLLTIYNGQSNEYVNN